MMTIEQFQAIFPRVPFSLHYVERGEQTKRRFGWHASFTSSYWTSDTDRPIYSHDPPRNDLHQLLEAWGETPNEALLLLARMVVNSAKRRAEVLKRDHAEAEAEAASLTERIK